MSQKQNCPSISYFRNLLKLYIESCDLNESLIDELNHFKSVEEPDSTELKIWVLIALHPLMLRVFMLQDWALS
jgi:hypothetical protein